MAKFKEGDWVQVTPQSDWTWSGWTALHDEYCGKIGYIERIWDFDDHTTYDVTVNFPYGFKGNNPGKYYVSFLSDHLILSSKYDSELSEQRERAGKELQEWEQFKRKATDDILRRAFSPQREEEDEEKIRKEEEEAWEAVTEEYVLPEKDEPLKYTDEEIDDLINQYTLDMTDMGYFDYDLD